MRVFIDPGHGGRDPGAVGDGADDVAGTPDDVLEKTINLQTAELLDLACRRRGWSTLLSRTTDVNVEEAATARRANDYRADWFVALHANGTDSRLANGYEVLHYHSSSVGEELARQIIGEIGLRFPERRSRGPKRRWRPSSRPSTFGPEFSRGWQVLSFTTMPAVLVEAGFVSHDYEELWLGMFENQARIAAAIVDAIVVTDGLRSTGAITTE